MARIHTFMIDTHSMTLQLMELDTNYNSSTRRTMDWYIGEGYMPTSDDYDDCDLGVALANKVSTSDLVEFTGLDADTEYGILCEVYKGSELLASLKAWVTTDSVKWEYSYEGTVTDTYDSSLSIDEYTVYRYAITFEYSGTATFYTEGDVDTYGYLSQTNSFDSLEGGPADPLIKNDDGGDGSNFYFTYDVDANTTYNLWVRGYSGEDYGDIDLYIEAPNPSWDCSSKVVGTISNTYEYGFPTSKYKFYRFKISFENSGTATFYTDDSGDTIGFLSEGSSYDSSSGEPTDILESNDGASDFYFTYDVEADTTYYLWVRHYYGEVTDYIYLYIEPPDPPPAVNKWSWTASNGSATETQTKNAYNAVVNGTAVSNFSYLVWNDMVDKVLEIVTALGSGWNDYYAAYENTIIDSSDKTLTAEKFNSLRYNIGSNYSTGIDEVSKGDPVLGEYFTTLADCINGWIDQDL